MGRSHRKLWRCQHGVTRPYDDIQPRQNVLTYILIDTVRLMRGFYWGTYSLARVRMISQQALQRGGCRGLTLPLVAPDLRHGSLSVPDTGFET